MPLKAATCVPVEAFVEGKRIDLGTQSNIFVGARQKTSERYGSKETARSRDPVFKKYFEKMEILNRKKK